MTMCGNRLDITLHLYSLMIIGSFTVISRPAKQDTTNVCYTRNTHIQIVTIQSPEAVVQLVDVRDKYKCGLWNLAECSRVSKKYKIVYVLRSKLSTSIRYECCPGFFGLHCGQNNINGLVIPTALKHTSTKTSESSTNTQTNPILVQTTSSDDIKTNRSATKELAKQLPSTEHSAHTTTIGSTDVIPDLNRPPFSERSTVSPDISRDTSITTTTDICYHVRPETRAITETVRLQALPADIKMYCQITFPGGRRNGHAGTRWVYNGDTILQINGIYTIEEWDYQHLSNGFQSVITSLMIVNASSCDIGDYMCEGMRGQCTHQSRIHLDCPDITPELLQEHQVAGCCPVLKKFAPGNEEDSRALNIAVPVILGILLVLVVIVLPIIIYKRFGIIQILVKYYCGHFEDYDDKLYDVYVSFDTEDVRAMRFVLMELRTFLSETGYSAFIFPLDSMPGSDKFDDIIDAMEQSRRVMLILGHSYRSCDWCRFEFITARRLFIKHRLRIIPILFGENVNDTVNDSDFSSILKCIPSISIPSTSEETLSNKIANKLRLCMPRHAKNESNQMHKIDTE